MEGMFFVEIVRDRLVTQGQVTGRAGPGHWTCAFFQEKGKPLTRVIPAERMGAMTLFQSAQDMEEWVKSISEPVAGAREEEEPSRLPTQLVTLPVKELRRIAKDFEIPTSGNKAALIKRIQAEIARREES